MAYAQQAKIPRIAGCGSTESNTPRPEVITGDAVIGLHIVDDGPPLWPGDPTPALTNLRDFHCPLAKASSKIR